MILHLDLDCFFAAAHRINNKKLLNIPIAVGGRSNLSIFHRTNQKRQISSIEGAFTSSILTHTDKSFDSYFIDDKSKIRGIVTTSSYEAREYGIKTAMSVAEALRLCPILTVIPPDYPLYHDLSYKLKLLLEKMLPSLEQFSIDEFFGDVTGWIADDEVYEFGKKLKQQIHDELGLPISIGIAKTKWIAKLATNDAKPYGVKIVFENEVEKYINEKNINEFCGIGSAYQNRLIKHGIKKLGDVKKRKDLFYTWGKFGIQLYNRILGTDNEHISLDKKSQKSIGLGRTFDPIIDRHEIKRRISILCRHLSFLLYKKHHSSSNFHLQIRYQDSGKSKDSINSNQIFSEQHLKNQLSILFDKIDIHPSHYIVQLNITLSNFSQNNTLNLFTLDQDTKQSKLNKSMQELRNKFGVDIIKSGGEL